MSSPEFIVVSTPSRLHFGLLSFGHREAHASESMREPSGVREFGGVGLMIERPAWRLSAAPADEFRAQGPQDQRVVQFASRYCQSLGMAELPAWELTVESAPPAHSGLGSGTQLGLAVATVMQTALELPAAPITELARRVGRGQRSAIGVYGFVRGGLLVEAGKEHPDEISPLVTRIALPDRWRVVLMRPRTGEGLWGAAERSAFERLPATTAELTGQLCEIVLRGLLPAAREGQFEEFGEAVYRYGLLAGSCFAAVQQGREFASAEIAALVGDIRRWGVAGVGQSSWGPTVFALCESQQQAERLATAMARPDWEQTITRISDKGARVQVNASRPASREPMHVANKSDR